MVMFTVLCLINGFTVFFPENWSVSGFLTAYVGIPIFLVMYYWSSDCVLARQVGVGSGGSGHEDRAAGDSRCGDAAKEEKGVGEGVYDH